MKKILLTFFAFLFGWIFIGQSSFAVTIQRFDNGVEKKDFPFKSIQEVKQVQDSFNNQQNATEDLGKMMAQTNIDTDKSLLKTFLDFFGFNDGEYIQSNAMGEKPPVAIIYIKSIINLLLSLLSLIALIILIYTFYLMFFSDDSAGLEKVKKNLTGIFIAIAILGLSWAIVSFIFNFYQNKVLSPTEKDLNIPSEQHSHSINES